MRLAIDHAQLGQGQPRTVICDACDEVTTKQARDEKGHNDQPTDTP